MGPTFNAFVRIGIAYIGIDEHTENFRAIPISAVFHVMQRHHRDFVVYGGNDCQNPHTWPDTGKLSKLQ